MKLKHTKWEGWHEFVMPRKELMARYQEVVRWLAEMCPATDRRMHALRTHWYMVKLRDDTLAVAFLLTFG